MAEIIILYCPCPTQEKALEIIQQLIGQSLIACGNVIPSKSCYPWEGQVCQEDEFVAIMKTVPSVQEKVTLHIEEIHPYDVPAIISWRASVNEKYHGWIVSEIDDEGV